MLTSATPVPAMVLMIPSGVTRRTRLLLVSAMYSVPSAARAIERGVLIWAASAGPPSPEKPPLPTPATVVTVPSTAIRRMRWLPESATNRLPAAS